MPLTMAYEISSPYQDEPIHSLTVGCTLKKNNDENKIPIFFHITEYNLLPM